MTTHDIDTVRLLTEKYFNATITEKENEALASFAKELADKGDSIGFPDSQLMADLQMIAALNDFSSNTLAAIASNTPEGLEERLETSISRLARASRWKRIKTALIPAVSAAAAVALIFTVGYRSTMTPQQSDENLNARIYIAKIVDPTPLPPVTNGISYPTGATVISNSVQKVTSSSGPVKNKVKKNIHPIVNEPVEQKAEVKQPEHIEPIENIIPVLAAAKIDPAQIALQPLSTLQNSVCNACESVDMVSTAFAGIAETFSMVNNSLALLNPKLGRRD